MSIPDELRIILNTNIPGFQTINYKPNMTITSEKNKLVNFWPLIKLNESIINKNIPESLRVKQFFDDGLFNSLLNTHGFQKDISLEDATKNGFIDNNISITLNYLFPEKGIIYINKNAYSIGDRRWEKGNWNISIKPKEVLDSSKITNPFIYTNLINNEIISGEKQINQLPENVIYGNNYTGEKNFLGRGNIETKKEA